MPGTPYNGNPGFVSPPTPIGITSSTFATPIVVQTSSPHGCKTNDVVEINLHTGNLTANGQWPVTVVDSTHASLNGSVGTGVGGATGNFQPLTFTGNVGLNPANGDPFDASTFIPGFSCLADRTAFLALATGAYKIANQTFLFRNDSVGTDFATLSTSTLATFQDFTGGLTWQVWDRLQATDIVLVDVDISFVFDKSGQSPTSAAVALAASQEPPGASPLYSIVNGSRRFVPTQFAPASVLNAIPIHLSGQYVAGIAGQGLVKLQGMWNAVSSSGNVVFHALGDYLFRATVLRPTSWPQ